MTTSERLADALFTELDDGRWEHTVLPLMKTRILTEEEKENQHSYSCACMRTVLYFYLGILVKTALLPWLIWLSVTTNLLYQDKRYSLYLISLAFVPFIVLAVIGFWQLATAKGRLTYRRVLKTAPRGRRVKWASYWRTVGSALGPLPIHIFFMLAAVCLFGTITLSASIGDIYLSDIVNMVLTCLLLGPAIPAGLRSKPDAVSELNS